MAEHVEQSVEQSGRSAQEEPTELAGTTQEMEQAEKTETAEQTVQAGQTAQAEHAGQGKGRWHHALLCANYLRLSSSHRS